VSVEREQGRNAEVKVYDLSGRLVRNNVKRQEATKGLPAGLYIVDGKKTLIR
jgi:hypothetical protein